MANNRWDGVLDGISFRLTRDKEGYQRFSQRQTAQRRGPAIGPAPGSATRDDQGHFYQTNWASGATWWRPMLGDATSGTYHFADGMDPTREPGSIYPFNKVVADAAATRGMYAGSPLVAAPDPVSGTPTVWTMSSTNDGTNYYLRYWKTSTDAWTNTAGTIGASVLQSLIYNPSDGNFYGLGASYIAQGNGTTSNNTYVAITGSQPGNLLIGLTGEVHYYNGDILQNIVADALVEVTDDGFGPDILTNMADGTVYYKNRMDLAVGSAEGIWYVKNIWNTGLPEAWLFRVDRDAAGNVVSNSVATLPRGNLALSLGFAQGVPIIVATSEWAAALENTVHYPTDVWSVVGGTLAPLGRVNTKDPTTPGAIAPRETVCRILGTWGDLVLFGGTTGVYGYDPTRGGFHHLFDTPTGTWEELDAVYLLDQHRLLFSTSYVDDHLRSNNLDTVTNFADNETLHTMYSNWFDFDLPGENKTITTVRTQVADFNGSANQAWILRLIKNDGTVVSSPSHIHSTDSISYETTGWAVTDERFRFRLTYNSKAGSEAPCPIIAIQMTAEIGQMLQAWQLTIDGSEFVNVVNARQDPLTVYDNWVSKMSTLTPVTYTDNYEAFDRTESTSHTVKIQSLSIGKASPNESTIQAVVVSA